MCAGFTGLSSCGISKHKVDAVSGAMHFHEFLTGLMKFFEEFARKSYTVTSEQCILIDNDKVININGGFFDKR